MTIPGTFNNIDWMEIACRPYTIAPGDNQLSNLLATIKTPLDTLLDDEVALLGRKDAYIHHNIPVPEALTARLDELERAIACAWQVELDNRIRTAEAEIEAHRSREEKLRRAADELEKLRAMRL